MNAAVIDASQCNSCSKLSLSVLKTNLSAISFYKKFDFESDGQYDKELYGHTKIIDIRIVKPL